MRDGMSQVPSIPLNDGHAMPTLGFGVWQVPDDEAESATLEALRSGYRSIDTAQFYGNEAGVGRALAKSGLPRADVFLTTKVWNTSQGRDATRAACKESLLKLGVTYLDLYLIHWPSAFRGLYVETWEALIELQREGLARSIGVSNFGPAELNEIIDHTRVTPAVNQIELHPRFQQREVRAFHKTHGIVTESWSPLGQGKILRHPTIVAIGEKHGRSAAQVILRWHLDHGLVAIPKSVTPSRIRENLDVFGFALDSEDMRALDGLDSADGRVGPDPVGAKF